MDIKIHPLQEKSVNLLRALYFDKQLPITKAMHSVIDGYYPSVESILATLKHYTNEAIVREFVELHEDSIQLAKEELKAKMESSAATSPELEEEPGNFFNTSDNSFPRFKIIDAYRIMKAKAITEVEAALSKALSDVYGEELVIEVQSFEKAVSNHLGSNVELKAMVKADKPLRDRLDENRKVPNQMGTEYFEEKQELACDGLNNSLKEIQTVEALIKTMKYSMPSLINPEQVHESLRSAENMIKNARRDFEKACWAAARTELEFDDWLQKRNCEELII